VGFKQHFSLVFATDRVARALCLPLASDTRLHQRTSVEMSLDTAGTSARATANFGGLERGQ